jgi:hypothetical protein
MPTISLSELDKLTIEAVWTTLHPTVRQRLLEVLATLAVKRLPQELAEPIAKEIGCLPHANISTLPFRQNSKPPGSTRQGPSAWNALAMRPTERSDNLNWPNPKIAWSCAPWNAPTTTNQERKQVLRLLIPDVTLAKTTPDPQIAHLRNQHGQKSPTGKPFSHSRELD